MPQSSGPREKSGNVAILDSLRKRIIGSHKRPGAQGTAERCVKRLSKVYTRTGMCNFEQSRRVYGATLERHVLCHCLAVVGLIGSSRPLFSENDRQHATPLVEHGNLVPRLLAGEVKCHFGKLLRK